MKEIMSLCIEAGGTITGEHGVGTHKPEVLEAQLGAVSLSVHDSIKRAFDPAGILNPGKVLRRK